VNKDVYISTNTERRAGLSAIAELLLRYAGGQTDKQTYGEADRNTWPIYRRQTNEIAHTHFYGTDVIATRDALRWTVVCK